MYIEKGEWHKCLDTAEQQVKDFTLVNKITVTKDDCSSAGSSVESLHFFC